MFDLLGIDGACSVVVDLFVDVAVDRYARGDGLRLDLRRGGLLLSGIHVDDF